MERKRLYRNVNDKMLCGVCSGLADYFNIDPTLVRLAWVVLAAMPAASTTAILAAKYGGDEVFATKCVVFTTLLSMVSAPVWCMVLQR